MATTTTGICLFAVQKCRLCSWLIESNNSAQKTNNGVNLLLNYLYHQNVRETIGSAVGGVNGDPSPKLTFTLSLAQLDTNPISPEEQIQLCKECHEELEKLDQLHQDLQAVKRKIQSQVHMIGYRQKRSGSKQQETNELIAACNIPKMQMSIAGSVAGKENISQALEFIGGLSDTMTKSGMAYQNQTFVIGTVVQPVVVQQADPQPVPENFNSSQVEPESVMKVEPEDAKIVTEIVPDDPLDTDENYSLDRSSLQIEVVNEAGEEEDLYFDEGAVSDSMDGEEDPLEGHSGNLEQGAPSSRKKYQNKLRTCTVCGKGIRGKTNFIWHMRVHTGERPFECDICKRRFVQQNHLERHRMVHTGEKPFSCDICRQQFSRKDTVIIHKMRKHGIIPPTR